MLKLLPLDMNTHFTCAFSLLYKTSMALGTEVAWTEITFQDKNQLPQNNCSNGQNLLKQFSKQYGDVLG